MNNPTIEEPKGYQNNPFLIAIDGIKLLFKRAQNTGIFLAVLSLILFLPNTTPSADDGDLDSSQANYAIPDSFNLSEQWPVIAIVVGVVLLLMIGLMLIAIYVQAIGDYTSAQLARGAKEVSLSEASRQAGRNFAGYLWVQIIISVKTLLWSLLLIIPGIYKANRYSLAGVVYFAEEGVRGDRALQRSQQLVNGAWLTTFAGQVYLNIVTFGIGALLVYAGSRTILYRQLNALGDKARPAASLLSKLLIIVPAVFMATIVLAGAAFFIVNK